MPGQLSPYALEGNLGSFVRFQVPAGGIVTRDMVNAHIVGGDAYSKGITIAISPLENSNFTNFLYAFCTVRFGNGRAPSSVATFDIGRGIAFTVPGNVATVQVGVAASGAGAVDISIGGFASIMGPTPRYPLQTLLYGDGPLAAGASVVITGIASFAKSVKITTPDNRIDDLFIEGLIVGGGGVFFGIRQPPGAGFPDIPLDASVDSLRITNVGGGDISMIFVSQTIEF
jgi:hypothetical protein